MLRPRYITQYLPLFDNRTDEAGRPIDRSQAVEEGAVVFQRNGIVILGHKGGFGFTRPIENVTFGGGCVANRSIADQVLVIKTPTGDYFRYRYVRRDANWYRLVVVERAPNRLVSCVHIIREDVADYGMILGLVTGIIRAGLHVARQLLAGTFHIGVVVAIPFVTRFLILGAYAHLSEEQVRSMIWFAWLVEGGAIGVFVLAELAFSRGGRLYRKTLPIIFLCGFIATSLFLFPSSGSVLRAVSGFRFVNTANLSDSPSLR